MFDGSGRFNVTHEKGAEERVDTVHGAMCWRCWLVLTMRELQASGRWDELEIVSRRSGGKVVYQLRGFYRGNGAVP